MKTRFTNNNAMSWEADIKAAREELRLHGHEMSEYERNVISREIKKRQEDLIPVVGARVIGEFKQSIKKYQDAQDKINAERQAEINRFDSSKYNNELQAMQARVKMALEHQSNPLRGKDKPVSQAIEEIYNEAMQSGEIHKQRVAVEVMKNIPLPGNQQDRIKVNQLAKNAEAVEVKLRQTEGTIKAQQEAHTALLELDERRETINKVSTLLGMGPVDRPFNNNAFTRAYNQVQRDPQTGEIKIYDEDAPEVTGVGGMTYKT